MTLVYFTRPSINTRRIFIGITDNTKIYRIGYKTVPTNTYIKLVRHYYEVTEEINIIDSPDMSLIDKKDIDFINYIKNIKTL